MKYFDFVLLLSTQSGILFSSIIKHVFISPGLVYCNVYILDHLVNESTSECCYLELTIIETKQFASSGVDLKL